MELKIEHILPYLLHNLEAEIIDYKCDYVGRKYDIIVGINQWDKSGKLWSLSTYGGAKPSPDKVKPILLPISEIKYCGNGLKHMGYKIEKDDIENIISDIKQGKAEYDIMQMCFQEHIDVFGLIKLGLAIDKNSLKN